MMKATSLCLIASWVVLGVACGSKDKPADNPPPSCPQGTMWNGATCAAMTGPGPTATTTATTPPPENTNPLPIPTVQPGPAATPVDATLAAAAGPVIDALAAEHAQGMSPVQTVAGNFGAGQVLTVDFQADPGRCYVAFAAGLPGVQEVDLQISPAVSMAGVPAPILAQDSTTGANAVLGAKPNCFKWAAPVGAPMRLTIRATQGQGLIAARLYAK